MLTPALPGAGGYYVTGEDNLRVTSFNALAGVTLAIESRLLDDEGKIIPSGDRHVPNTDRTAGSTIIPLGTGWLIDVMVRASTASPRRGQCYVVVELVRGSGAGATPVALVGQGYVTDTGRLGFPRAPNQWSTEGPGCIRSILGTDPAAGAEILETVPTNARWRVLAFKVVLVADANVANRVPMLVLDDGALDFLRAPTNTAQAASATVHHSWGDFGYLTFQGSLGSTIALPSGILLPGGFRLRTSTANMQAGDNYGAPQLLVEEWIED